MKRQLREINIVQGHPYPQSMMGGRGGAATYTTSAWPARYWVYGSWGFTLNRARDISRQFGQRVWVFMVNIDGEWLWAASLDPKHLSPHPPKPGGRKQL